MNPTYEHHRPYDGCDLYRGDALDVLPLLAEEGITADMVLSDPPYGTTHCRWDAVIDIPGMWNAVQGISRPDTPVLLFCQHPFTSLLGSSNLRRLRYAWVWEKTQATGFLNAGRMPMKAHEDILVFYDRLPKYHPIKTDGHRRKVVMAEHTRKCLAFEATLTDRQIDMLQELGYLPVIMRQYGEECANCPYTLDEREHGICRRCAVFKK